MSIQTIKMPDIGEGIAEVELVVWHVKVGDVVAEDQILADVMTDKATVEIPSSVAGTVVSLNVTAGQVVAVGTEIIHIEVQGSVQPAVDAAVVPAPAPAPAAAAPTTTAPVARPRGALSIAAPAVRRQAW
ncbi:MAG TPA: biotin/lipoyl-containing protein, partial [Rhodoferax sp.]